MARPSRALLAWHMLRALRRRAQSTEEAASVMAKLSLTSPSRLEKRLSRWLRVGKAEAKSYTVRSSCCCRACRIASWTLQSRRTSESAAENF